MKLTSAGSVVVLMIALFLGSAFASANWVDPVGCTTQAFGAFDLYHQQTLAPLLPVALAGDPLTQATLSNAMLIGADLIHEQLEDFYMVLHIMDSMEAYDTQVKNDTLASVQFNAKLDYFRSGVAPNLGGDETARAGLHAAVDALTGFLVATRDALNKVQQIRLAQVLNTWPTVRTTIDALLANSATRYILRLPDGSLAVESPTPGTMGMTGKGAQLQFAILGLALAPPADGSGDFLASTFIGIIRDGVIPLVRGITRPLQKILDDPESGLDNVLDALERESRNFARDNNICGKNLWTHHAAQILPPPTLIAFLGVQNRNYQNLVLPSIVNLAGTGPVSITLTQAATWVSTVFFPVLEPRMISRALANPPRYDEWLNL